RAERAVRREHGRKDLRFLALPGTAGGGIAVVGAHGAHYTGAMVRKTAAPKTARKRVRKAVSGAAAPRGPKTSAHKTIAKLPVDAKARKQNKALGRKPAASESPPWTNAEI